MSIHLDAFCLIVPVSIPQAVLYADTVAREVERPPLRTKTVWCARVPIPRVVV